MDPGGRAEKPDNAKAEYVRRSGSSLKKPAYFMYATSGRDSRQAGWYRSSFTLVPALLCGGRSVFIA